jgi:hypothetical protein
MWDIFPMIKVKTDDRRRVVLPGAKPKQEFTYLERKNGTVILTPVKLAKEEAMVDTWEKLGPPPTVKFIKKDGYTVGHTDKRVSLETIKELLAEFP